MKLLIYADPHWCQYSSILRSRGLKYSTRLECLIDSLNWIENLAEEKYCDSIVCLGDFFDNNFINAEEISALKEVKFNKSKEHIFLCGNHEITSANREFSTINIFALDFKVIDEPLVEEHGNFNIVWLPYLNKDELNNVDEFFVNDKKSLILSHNDIKGLQYGGFCSESGIPLDLVDNENNIFINGHLHNGSKFAKNAMNLGNLTGQNFAEDATKYKHKICIVDTDGWVVEFVENPYAIGFYKFDLTNCDIDETLDCCSNDSVVSIVCSENDYEYVKEKCTRFTSCKIRVDKSCNNTESNDIEDLRCEDHIAMFRDYILKEDDGKIMNEELSEVLK